MGDGRSRDPRGSAALRAGAGLVRLAIPEALFPIVQVGVPEATCIERNLSNLDLAAYDAICAGPGLGEGEESIALITKLLEEYRKNIAHRRRRSESHRASEFIPTAFAATGTIPVANDFDAAYGRSETTFG